MATSDSDSDSDGDERQRRRAVSSVALNIAEGNRSPLKHRDHAQHAASPFACERHHSRSRPSQSPIAVAHRNRPSQSPIAIAHRSRPSQSPIAIAHRHVKFTIDVVIWFKEK
jgi:hypothetical protein